MILRAQTYILPCKGCTVLKDTRYPGSLDSSTRSLLMGWIRNAASCFMMEISSASVDEGGGAVDSPAWQDDAQLPISWLGLCTYSLTAVGLCYTPATRNISDFSLSVFQAEACASPF